MEQSNKVYIVCFQYYYIESDECYYETIEYVSKTLEEAKAFIEKQNSLKGVTGIYIYEREIGKEHGMTYYKAEIDNTDKIILIKEG